MNNFDSVAPFYDRLSSMVFGRSMVLAQTFYLNAIEPGANVLVLGGGTGWLLEELFKRNPSCHVWYIESSAKMMQRSKERNTGSAEAIVYLLGTEDAIPKGITFDAVITHFYLDLFQPDTCKWAICKIRASLHPRTVWLVADFMNTTWWHGAMLSVMYTFFKAMQCGIEARKIPDWKKLLEQNGFIEAKYAHFYAKFIRSSLFQLTE